MRRSLIVGCGYVGSALARRLSAAGDALWAVSRQAPDALLDLDRVQLGAADVTQRLQLKDALAEALAAPLDNVCYLVAAGRHEERAYRSAYVDGLANLLELLSEQPNARLFFASSTAVYGQRRGERVDESSLTEPEGFAGRVLLEAEQLAHKALQRTVVVRFGGIYGPGRERLISRIRRGQALGADRRALRNRIHRDDCAAVLQHLMNLDDPAPCYVAVDNEPGPLGRVEAWLCAQLGCSAAALVPAEPGPFSTATSKHCSNALLRASGFELLYPSFREGYGALLRSTAV